MFFNQTKVKAELQKSDSVEVRERIAEYKEIEIDLKDMMGMVIKYLKL